MSIPLIAELTTLETVGIVAGVLSGVSGCILGGFSLLHQWWSTHPHIVVRPYVRNFLNSETLHREINVGCMEVSNVGQLTVTIVAVGCWSKRRGRWRKGTFPFQAIDDANWSGELRSQDGKTLRFDAACLGEGRGKKLGRAFVETIIGDRFKVSWRDMRRLRKCLAQRRPASPHESVN